MSAPTADACAAALLETLPHAMDALRMAMRAQVGDDLTIPQFRCLAFIDREGGQTTVSGVAAFIGVTLPTASTMIDRLVRAGSVIAESDEADRRRLRLRTSPEGRALLQRIRQGARGALADSLSPRSGDDLVVLMRGLDVLRSTFGSR